MNVAILGSGKIACDLLVKILNHPQMQCVLFCGRRQDSPGIAFAQSHRVPVSINGVVDLLQLAATVDVVFDATSAASHLAHYPQLQAAGFKVINLTPAPADSKYVPVVSEVDFAGVDHVSLITCGAQATIPLVHAMAGITDQLDYVEVVTTISAKSAGIATRQNISEYQAITEKALRDLTGCVRAKSILIINPAEPPIHMQSAIYLLAKHWDLPQVKQVCQQVEARMQQYVPGFSITTSPVYDEGRLVLFLRVAGQGDFLPAYAGNLDIITAVAVKAALFIVEDLAIA